MDFLAKDGELNKILTELITTKKEVLSLCTRARQATSHIRACISPVDPKAIVQELVDFSKNNNDILNLRSKLLKAANRLNRLHDFKQGGLEAIPESHTDGATTVSLRNDVQTLLSELEARGLFLVQVGELESWLPIIMKGQSREDKSKWAMLAAEKIEDVGERDDDVWRFINTVYCFLQKTLESFVGVSTKTCSPDNGA
ncbi:hypothetical protein ACFL30_01255 [Candidatus Latescibacterota bacterium]